jgi:hypothetical protein
MLYNLCYLIITVIDHSVLRCYCRIHEITCWIHDWKPGSGAHMVWATAKWLVSTMGLLAHWLAWWTLVTSGFHPNGIDSIDYLFVNSLFSCKYENVTNIWYVAYMSYMCCSALVRLSSSTRDLYMRVLVTRWDKWWILLTVCLVKILNRFSLVPNIWLSQFAKKYCLYML